MIVARWSRQHRLAVDALIAVCFALLDTGATLTGASWWPVHPGPLAWVMLAAQALADLSLTARRRAPMVVIAILGGYTLALSLLISPAGALTPANAGNVWAPFGTVLAAYGPFYYCQNRRTAFAAVGVLTAHRGQDLGAVGDGDHDRRAQDSGRAATGPVLQRPS